ncbi:hypothetical protein [Neptuniibacter sp.]|uniref:hypothetical protein n=1 Tax=Neptuniibacter sp. TaxID=1962643 RepID=UPI003B5988C8
MFDLFWTGRYFNPETATISHYWDMFLSILSLIFFFPGNVLIYTMIENFPRIAHFLEFSTLSYNSMLSGVISTLIWFITAFLYVFISITLKEISEAQMRENIKKKRKALGYED